jgi:sugar transferase EpsL
MRSLLIKRIFDIIFSLALMLILLPVFLVVAISVLIFLGSPIIFKQRRPGLRGNPFYIYKFRTMHNMTDAQGNLLDDGQRLTRFGQFLRSTSLDELPELWNVLSGTMSFVGPRPLIMEYLTRYSSEQSRRHDVKPGITGLAQINGRNMINWEERFKLDVFYVDHWNLWLDIKILLRTIIIVFSRKGINETGFATASFFVGNNDLKDKKK